MRKLYCLLILFFFALNTWAAQIQEMRIWPEPEKTRIVFDTSGPIDYQVFTLDNPKRLVLDIKKTSWRFKNPQFSWHQTPVSSVRTGPQPNGGLRIVLDLKRNVRVEDFALVPNGVYGHRLVLDLFESGSATVAKAPPPIEPMPAERAALLSATPMPRMSQKKIVIAIDAGHGGEDPGAIGPQKTREKDVVLAIARELYAQMSREPGMQPVLIRSGDYYIPLRTRIVKARQAQADLFISIHADAFKNRNAKGASVYTLSARGASTEAARWLAETENRADLIGGVSLDDKDDVLAKVLLDLSQTVSSESSFAMGNAVLHRLGGITDLHGRRVQQAGFAVLKSPDIPSILVETEFISNPKSEKKLKSKAYQRQVANAILSGVKAYLKEKSHQYQLPAVQQARGG